MSVILDTLSWLSLLAGGALVVTGGIGLLRLPDFFTRLHAASLTDTLGFAFIVLGLALQSGAGLTSLKLFLALAFLLLTGPVATHALAKAALHGSLRPVDLRGDTLEAQDVVADRLAPGDREDPAQ